MLPVNASVADLPAEVDNVSNAAEDDPMEPRNDSQESVLARTVMLLENSPNKIGAWAAISNG